MWVESEVAKGSKFFFTSTSQTSYSTMEATFRKMASFACGRPDKELETKAVCCP